MHELNSAEAVAAWLRRGHREPAAVQAVNLATTSPPFDKLELHPFPNSLFLACELTEPATLNLVATGAVVIPSMDVPYETHRGALYDAESLFAGYDGTYEATHDYRVYQHYVVTGKPHPATIDEALARRLHDHSITDALHEEITDRKVVAVMGGHSIVRASPTFRTVALISRELTRRGYLMISGGGPGAMEATHVGAWMAPHNDASFDEALEILGKRQEGIGPDREYTDPDWLERAWQVRTRWAADTEAQKSIGIPTWLYGHEPPTPLATHIAKYFANSVREEGLLAVATHGVIFSPGGAGTTQEIFQDLTQNHYGTFGPSAPMILLGTEHWTSTRPVWALLETVTGDEPYASLVALTDDAAEVVRRITEYEPRS